MVCQLTEFHYNMMTGLTWLLVLTSVACGLGVEIEYVTVRGIQRRSADGLERIHLRAFGEDHNLVLQPAQIFSPGFHAISIRETGDEERRSTDVLTTGKFYSVLGTRGTVYMKQRDIRSMEGLLSHNLRITPHVNKRSPDDTATHVVHRYPVANSVPDDIRYPENIEPRDIDKVAIDKRQTAPSKVTVEILAVIDYRNSKALNFDTNKLATYVGIFWNSAYHVYSDLKDPQVSLVVSGMIVTKNANDEPYIKNNMYGNDGVKDKMLNDFKEWLAGKESSMPKHDTAMIHTALDTGSVSNGQWNPSLAGLAYMGTTCRTDGYESGFIEDKVPEFTGVLFGVHELAHTLNVPHDGDGDAKSCSKSDGYVMGTSGRDTPNSWKFSSCSQRIIRDFLKSSKGSCTYNKPATVVSDSTELPFFDSGSLDDLCKIGYGAGNIFVGKIDPSICNHVICKDPNSKTSWIGAGALEGTPCEVGKVCLKGTCSPNNIPSLDQQCSKVFGAVWGAKEKTSPSVCSKLVCSKPGYEGSVGMAIEGSTCGNYGVCKNGQCILQALSLNDQCKRNFGSGFYYYTSSNSACEQLWCTKDGRSLTSIGGADPYSSCASGKICRNSQCSNA